MPPVSISELNAFDDVIDVRSPGEFAEDHIPGAINLPVLSDLEREQVGTTYKQISSFEAKKMGAALVSRNIAQHLDAFFASKPKPYRPLIYCWRGGSRSGSLTHVLQKIGFGAAQLDGGYKAYRRHVLVELDRLPAAFRYRVVSGTTGSGKSRVLAALTARGAQVLDLEMLAAHRGSLLGALPDQPQPPQKGFESAIWSALARFEPTRTVYVESESKKIGALRVPDALIHAMRASPCVRIDVPVGARVQLLIEDYAHFFHDPEAIKALLSRLIPLRGHDTIRAWLDLVEAQAWEALVAALLEQHYDPAYLQSLTANYAPSAADFTVSSDDLTDLSVARLADEILRAERER